MKKLGRYRILAEIARGGAGVVYMAYDPQRRCEVAIKLLLAGPHATPTARERFRREAQALGKLRHPHVVSVREVGVHEGDPFLVMELLQGETLQARLDRDGPLPIAEALEIVGKVSQALAHAHEKGVLHRDVKPENVLVDGEGQPVLTDFGLTREVEPATTEVQLSVRGRGMGTPGYWPPEQARGELEHVGPHSDVYGLGGLLVALLTGAPPHGVPETLIEAVVKAGEEPPPPSARRAEIPAELDALCLRALAVEPGARHPDAGAFGAALDEVVRALQVVTASGQAGRRAVALAGVLALFALGLGVLAWARRSQPTADSQAEGARAPTDAVGYLARGRERGEARDFERALVDFTEAIRLQPDLAEAYHGRGVSHYRLGRQGEALIDAERALELDPQLAKARTFRGELRYEQGDEAGALADLDEAIRLEPTSSYGWRARAVVRFKVENLRGALADAEEALRLEPDQADVHTLRGYAHEKLGETEAAVQAYGHSLRLRPGGAEVHAKRGRLRARLEDPRGAIEDYTEALRLKPGEALVHRLRGQVHATRRDWGAAIDDFSQAIRLDPDDDQAYAFRGAARHHREEWRGALEDYDVALRLGPDDKELRRNRAGAKLGLGDLEGAAEEYEQALRLDPDWGLGWFGLGSVELQRKRSEPARRALERALELDPDAEWVAQARQRLSRLREPAAAPTPSPPR